VELANIPRPGDELSECVRNFVISHSTDLLIDRYVGYSGDDIHIIMTHTFGVDNSLDFK
jgi:fructose 1,6-bisphosphate aldolase/phosphatase